MKEDYSKLKMKSRNYETVELERDELVRQLNLGKDDLFHEQKQARIQKEELQLELESITSQLEEVQSCRDELQQTLSQLQSNYSRLEMEKNDILQKKSQEFDVLNNSRRYYDKEMVDLQQEVHESKIKMADLQERNNEKDELNLKLKDQNIELQQLLAKEEESREVILQDHKRLLLNFRKETDAAMMQLRESLFLEKQTALENLRDEIENDRRESLKRNDEKLAQILTENAKIISSKNDEITQIQTLLKNLEEERRQMEQKLQEEIQRQVTQAVTRERNLLETEKDWAIRRERDSLITENNRKVEEMSAILQQERNMKEDLQQQIKNTQKELEEQRNHNRQASKDKMVAVARAKEMMREQTNGEIERIKDKVKEDNKREIEELKETVKNLEEEIQKLRSDKQQLCRVEREVNSTLDRTERTVINEINEECRRSASVLGISPRKVHLASFRAESPVAMGGSPTSSKYRTPVTSSLANLRACNEELRTHLYELKQELDSQKSLYNKSQKDKEDSLENLKRKLEKEKSSELDQLKERLVREHITQMNRLANQYITEGNHSLPTEKTPNFWKNNLREESPEYYIKRYEQEISKDRMKHGVDRCPSPEFKHINDLQQDEINRLEREIQKLALHRGNRKPPRPKRDIKTPDGDKLHHRQTIDYQPVHSNNFYTGSVPDLTNPDLYRQVPLRARLSAERESMAISLSERIKMDEQQAPDPELTQIFSKPNQKMSEMNKLQNTLTSQNKELMELERAYNQLNKNYDHRSPSPSLHFRSTR
ncbi:golgin subfamily A member 4 isoform X1 [Patella vulgata]|uniref:golgin subfamily A member 4 isoform X1 n=2 Tax=Patella vulgata TaxID=6465 RepID=UPI0024A993F7|nr:golgin subfamily A member 4 isoform X1 [Patella vulgata]